jgi:hypothetical protein
MISGKCLCLLGLLLLLLSPAPSCAEITFLVSPDGDTAFTIEGDDITITAKVELTVIYDSSMLAHPRVSVEGGTVTNLTDFDSGTLTFVANQGNEPTPSFVAHVSFDKVGDAPGGIFSVTGKIVEQDGMITPSSTMPNPSTPSVLAWVSHDAGMEQPGAADETGTSGNSPYILMKAQKSVLQRFREFRGERRLRAFAALFAGDPRDPLVQEPSIVLSDGETPVRIAFARPTEMEDPPNVALSDAKLVNVRKEGKKGWVITALPNKGTWNARLIVETDGQRIEFPLAAVPPVRIPTGITETNFVAELGRFITAQSGAGKGANGPLRHILYEYLFTANYLASAGHYPAKMASAEAHIGSSTR